MSRWQTETLALEIGAAAITLGSARLNAPAGDWAALAGELGSAVPARARLQVIVADNWARYFLLDPPAGVASLRDCRLLLQARFEALYGHSAADWVLQADWQAGRAMMACALPRSLVQSLDGCRLGQLVPALLAQWNRQCGKLPASGAWCVSSGEVLNLLVWHEGSLKVVRQQRGGSADGLLALELARLDLAVPSARLWSGHAMPSGWSALGALQ